jgi:hypothetical protein
MIQTPIFIGGVGRCGTTVLKNSIGAHPDVHTFKGELRWLSDPDGLGSLYNTLTKNWSPFVADLAIKRFRALLMDTLSMRYVSIFGFKSGAPLERMIDWIVAERSDARYYGWRDMPTLETDPIVMRQQLSAIIHRFFDDLFEISDIETGYWIDDTPENVCYFKTYNEIWPDARCIHAIRHPLDIIASIKARNSRKDFSQIWWWPKDARTIAKRVRFIFDHWHAQKNLPPSIYVKLENFAADPERMMRVTSEWLGLEYVPEMAEQIQPDRANIGRYKKDLTPTEIRQCRYAIAPILRNFDYTIEE